MKIFSKLYFTISFLVVVLLSGCFQKETVPSNPPKTNTVMRASDYYGQIQVENGLLVFPSMEVYETIVSELDIDCKNYNNAFVAEWGHLNEDAFNAKIEELGHNEDQPLADLENHFQFSSLRIKIENEENAWLNAGGEDVANDPDNHFVIDETERTLFNEWVEIKIGTSLFKLEEFRCIEIVDGNYATLLAIRGGANPNDFPNVKIHRPDRAECDTQRRNWDFKTNGSNDRRIKWVISHWTPFPSSGNSRRVMAKTKNYKKQGGSWKKFAVYCEAQGKGFISDVEGDCSKQLNFNPNSSFNSATAKKVKHKIQVQIKTKSGWVSGVHNGAGGITFNSSLTW